MPPPENQERGTRFKQRCSHIAHKAKQKETHEGNLARHDSNRLVDTGHQGVLWNPPFRISLSWHKVTFDAVWISNTNLNMSLGLKASTKINHAAFRK